MLDDPRLVEPADAEPRIQPANCQVLGRFLTLWRVGAPNPPIVQGSAALTHCLLSTRMDPQNLDLHMQETRVLLPWPDAYYDVKARLLYVTVRWPLSLGKSFFSTIDCGNAFELLSKDLTAVLYLTAIKGGRNQANMDC